MVGVQLEVNNWNLSFHVTSQIVVFLFSDGASLTWKVIYQDDKIYRVETRRYHVSQAYVHWQQQKVDEWWTSTREGQENPTQEQEAFLQCVVDRCAQEQLELQQLMARQHRKGGKKSKEKKKRSSHPPEHREKMTELQAMIFDEESARDAQKVAAPPKRVIFFALMQKSLRKDFSSAEKIETSIRLPSFEKSMALSMSLSSSCSTR